MTTTAEDSNRRLVLEAFDTLFNKRDHVAAARFRSTGYVRHSAHIAAGREGLFDLVGNAPASLRYEPGLVLADGDCVVLHGRFSGTGQPGNRIAVDIVRLADAVLAEHWDVLQDEATRDESQSKRPIRRHLCDLTTSAPESKGARQWQT